MYRIPTTNEGALGGDREAAPTAGTPQGRLGNRGVSQAPRLPGPHLLEVYEGGSGVAPAEVQRDITTRLVTEVPASRRFSGATALPRPGPGQGDSTQPLPAGDVREQSGTLSEPVPRPSYRGRWNAFVHWCEDKNVQHWPANPETVAGYLRESAPRISYQSLAVMNAAISATHRDARRENPCATNLVRTTLREMRRETRRSWTFNERISEVSLNAEQIEAVRTMALQPRARGGGKESLEMASNRAQVDLALCSLSLEGGLSVEQAAALEWRDLGVDDTFRVTLTIRTKSDKPSKVIAISDRAYDDLVALAPDACEPNEKIFSIGPRQLTNRTRMMLRAAEIGGSEVLRTEQAESAGARLLSEKLDRNMFEAIRATALAPRPNGLRDGVLGWESHEAAQKRGRVDTALLWVLQAAKFTIPQAAALKWGDVEKRSQDELRLTVRSGADPEGSADVRVLTGEAVRDLEALRGDAQPEDSVFGLVKYSLYRRVREALQAARSRGPLGTAPIHSATPGPPPGATPWPNYGAMPGPSTSAMPSPPPTTTAGPPRRPA